MSFRSMAGLGLLSLVSFACDQTGLGGPPAQVAQPLRIARACMSPLGAWDGGLNAILSVELAPNDVDADLPTRLIARTEDDGSLTLSDDGKDGDAVAGDGRFSVAVAGPAELRPGQEVCGKDIDFSVEPGVDVQTGALSDGSGDMFHNCPFRPMDEADCLSCGGSWNNYYYCDWWYGCYVIGQRCYGW